MAIGNRPVRIGFVGVGAISGIYLKNITETFRDIEIIGVCDLIRERAENAVKKFKIPKLYNDMYELFADPEHIAGAHGNHKVAFLAVFKEMFFQSGKIFNIHNILPRSSFD